MANINFATGQPYVPQEQKQNDDNSYGSYKAWNQSPQQSDEGYGSPQQASYGQAPIVINVAQQQESAQAPQYAPVIKTMDKNVFTWVGTFLFGAFGVDRFMRGQVGLGILKLITIGGMGVWATIDFIVALTKVYGNAFSMEEDVTFINGKYAR